MAIGLLGGTFDPIHYGHLRIALEVLEALNLDAVRFIPCREPVYQKTVQTNAAHRLAMVQCALNGYPQFIADARELNRKTPSYAVLTLQSLRQEFPQSSLCWIMGADQFADLYHWYQWEQLIDLCHLVVVSRGSQRLIVQQPEVQALLERTGTKDKTLLTEVPRGAIYHLKTTRLDISSTKIRNLVAAGRNPHFLTPECVVEYIAANHLFMA